VIHPGMNHEITAIRYSVRENEQDLPDLVLEYELAAEDYGLVSGKHLVPGQEMASVAWAIP